MVRVQDLPEERELAESGFCGVGLSGTLLVPWETSLLTRDRGWVILDLEPHLRGCFAGYAMPEDRGGLSGALAPL